MMKQKLEPIHRQEPTREDGMLFVRTEGILQTMVRAPIILAGLIIVAVMMPLQYSFSSTRNLDVIVYPDGSTHVMSVIEVDPLEPDFTVKLYGNTIDNFVAQSEDGDFLLSSINENMATVETFGISTILVNYDIHDLVSKEGRIWTFSIDAPSNFGVLMPKNSVIVGMSGTIPISLETVDEQSKIILPAGQTQIDYIFSSPMVTPSNPTQPIQNSQFDSTLVLIGGGIAAAGIGGAIAIQKTKKKETKVQKTSQSSTQSDEKPLDAETIFQLRPDLRDDDKEIVTFLFENGGQALESELRKKFLQPRTTMWRAVKRLERYGVIDIEKKDLQNLVKLKSKLEEEQ